MTLTRQSPLGTRFGHYTRAADIIDSTTLSGKTAVLTGGYSGLGIEITRALTNGGAHVVVPARRPDIARTTLAEFGDAVSVSYADLADSDSLRQFAEQFIASGRPLEMLINNAATMACPLNRIGHWDSQFAINHLGHFALTNYLFPALASAGASRVVSVSSSGHHFSPMRWEDVPFESGYDKWLAYGQSKTANALFAVHLDALGRAHGVRSFSLHPGSIMTPLLRHLPHEEMVDFGWIDDDGSPVDSSFKTVEQGAATAVWAATAPDLTGLGGLYLEDCDVAVPAHDDRPFVGVRDYASDADEAARLWRYSADAVGVDAFS
ncbi:oxidoreductase [Rhodococcus qingshengii]|uniref:oxidoreductase n=1 Tax=Rhodococcus qingshengii TaxID=334542 RepID=UPI001F147FD0|nr:oxidoreductase [Rhodococcus qingshengii]ULD38873.1 oxidoreductase [Rhodococcus qingshengii]